MRNKHRLACRFCNIPTLPLKKVGLNLHTNTFDFLVCSVLSTALSHPKATESASTLCSGHTTAFPGQTGKIHPCQRPPTIRFQLRLTIAVGRWVSRLRPTPPKSRSWVSPRPRKQLTPPSCPSFRHRTQLVELAQCVGRRAAFTVRAATSQLRSFVGSVFDGSHGERLSG